ncbi:MAG: aspartate--tRNA ligase [Dehalococcoidia bacterium]|nr:aspartate--tRNA ligase [Dehalococcoidia bacterium]
MLKSHSCGELSPAEAGQVVRLAGWVHRRRDHGGLIFLDVRDRTGLVQVVVDPSAAESAYQSADALRNEWVVAITGEVQVRPAGTENPRIATGGIEIHASEVTVLNPSKTPPFYINEDSDVDESLRLQYRYLDLRRERMAANLVLRHRVVKYIRDFLDGRGFLEVETPMLMKSTPEGARDYLVPSRVHPGHFYALPQSPQQLKQLLMVAGVERYFQIARCFRDEDQRADRQPEFTQLDLEMSFVDESDVLDLMEELYTGLAHATAPEKRVTSPFPRMTYAEAMRRFGSDNPDRRCGMEITYISPTVADSGGGVCTGALAEAGGTVRGIVAPGCAGYSRRELENLTEIVRGQGARGLATIGLDAEAGTAVADLQPDTVRSALARHLDIETVRAIADAMGAGAGDLLLIVAAHEEIVSASLSALRTALGERLELADPDELAFAFVTEFPLFEAGDEGSLLSVHHPFTAPVPEDAGLLEESPTAVRSRAYDLVVNGIELGSGSIRIHDRELQDRIFALLGHSPEEIEERFGHMLEAFEYGVPPHGGFAPGIDRTVMVLAGEPNIREVIPFPKTQSAQDLMMSAPSTVDEQQLVDLNLRLREAAQEITAPE